MNGLILARWIIVFLLFVALGNQPYVYYTFLRVAVCGLSGFLAYLAYNRASREWAVVMGITAIVYNPIVSIHLSKSIWQVLNLLTIVLMVVSISKLTFKKGEIKIGKSNGEGRKSRIEKCIELSVESTRLLEVQRVEIETIKVELNFDELDSELDGQELEFKLDSMEETLDSLDLQVLRIRDELRLLQDESA